MRTRRLAWRGRLTGFAALSAGALALTLGACHRAAPGGAATPQAASPATAAPAGARPAPPAAVHPDVDSFIARREICDHFRGEDPYDKDRRAFIARKIAESCTGTDAELARLRTKYRDDFDVMGRLFQFDEKVE